MSLFTTVVPTATASVKAEKLDKGLRPWDVFRFALDGVTEPTDRQKDKAYAKAFASFLRVENFEAATMAPALYAAALQYAAAHKAVIHSQKTGREVEIIDGLNFYGRPARGLRAFLEGKPVEDADGMMLHVADMFWSAKADVYKGFLAAVRAAMAPATPASEDVRG